MGVNSVEISVEQFNPNMKFEYLLEKALGEDFVVIQVSMLDYDLLIDFIQDNKANDLSLEQNLQLVGQLISLNDYLYTPTRPKKIPLRIDILINKKRKQPGIFLGNYLRRVTEWFGLAPISGINKAWEKFSRNNRDVVQLPEHIRALFDEGGVVISKGQLYLPAFLLLSLIIVSTPPSWDTLSDLLHNLRHKLLENYYKNSLFEQYFLEITNYLENPTSGLENKELEKKLARGELVDVSKIDFIGEINQLVIDGIIAALHNLYEEDQTRYRQAFGRNQALLWGNIIKAHREIATIEMSLPAANLLIDSSDWISSCREVTAILKVLSDAYAVLSKFEETLGVDRYLGSKVISPDLDSIHNRIRIIRDRIQNLLSNTSDIFLRQWNLSQITPIILNSLGISKIPASLTSYFPQNLENVIFILVDGLGYTQFRWLLKTIALHTVSPLATNIFGWLDQRKAFNETYILASNLISVTGGCLPTIYTGSLPRKTGIFGSHSLIEGNTLNILKGQVIGYNSKSLSTKEISEIFYKNTNQLIPSICDIALQNGIYTSVIHGGAGNFYPFLKYTYGERINKSGKYSQVPQADRVFSQTVQLMSEHNWQDSKKNLFLIYYPAVDSSGHPCGPYTQFQSTELAKLNFLFTHFLIDLVENFRHLFDGKTAIFISADHGMYESSSTVINDRIIRQASNGLLTDDVKIVHENRACYIYGIQPDDLELVQTRLVDYFSTNNIPINVYTKHNGLINDLLFDPNSPYSNHFPDILLQFYGTGIFFHKENLESHMFLYGAHGGCSIDEIFVPLIYLPLTYDLAENLARFYK
jgi:hypothetical protein